MYEPQWRTDVRFHLKALVVGLFIGGLIILNAWLTGVGHWEGYWQD